MKRELMTTNNIIELVKGYSTGKNYVEIGVYRGVLLAEVAKVAKNAVGVDNFCQFNDGTNESVCRERIGSSAKLIVGDCFDGNITKRIKNVDVVFYDAGHSFEETFSAVQIYWKKIAKKGVLIMDDWNVEHIRDATIQAIPAGEYDIVFERYTAKNASDDWWNGIVVIQKK